MAYYHPTDELLIQFSAGNLPNALGLMIACHVESCTQCQSQAKVYEQLGGEVLLHHEASPVSDSLLESVLKQLDKAVESKTSHPPSTTSASSIPRPLQRFISSDYQQLNWSGFTSSIKEITLPFSDQQYTAKLYKIAAGKELPVHTHLGNEFTLVMKGSFSDNAGHYHSGDFIQTDTTTVHQPKAANDVDCICFAILDAPLKMTGFLGRMLNPFLR